MTDVIDSNPPTEKEVALTEALKGALPARMFDTDEGMAHRRNVLSTLDGIIQDWVKAHVQTKLALPLEIAQTIRAKVFTFGSYRLGVHGRDSDIDTLVCFSHHIEHEDFFGSLYEKLGQLEQVSDLHAAPDAFVPAIKLAFEGVEMDLLMARTTLETVPDDLDLQDVDLLRNVDEKTARSLNGCRVTDTIRMLVYRVEPEHFQLCLRTIKLWAKAKNIYSNGLGYLGGVHLALLVAKLCQMFPQATAAKLLDKFFWVYSNWDWECNAVLLQDVDDLRFPGLPHWDPRKNRRDASHLMKIITPCYPQQNASYTVNQSTLRLIIKEFQKGHEVMRAIMSQDSPKPWSMLWRKSNFFAAHQYYVMVRASAATQEDRTLFEGLVESKIRRLAEQLMRVGKVAYASPLPKSFHRTKEAEEAENPVTAPFETYWFIGLTLGQRSEGGGILRVTSNMPLDITPAADFFYSSVAESRNHHHNESMAVDINPATRSNLPEWLWTDGGMKKPDLARAKKRKKATVSAAPPVAVPAPEQLVTAASNGVAEASVAEPLDEPKKPKLVLPSRRVVELDADEPTAMPPPQPLRRTVNIKVHDTRRAPASGHERRERDRATGKRNGRQ
eukprot:m.86525 g.86525  ORF g.86525 m.86525 type:complete len:613 (-) comp12813_c0_seq4:296-2134(-)